MSTSTAVAGRRPEKLPTATVSSKRRTCASGTTWVACGIVAVLDAVGRDPQRAAPDRDEREHGGGGERDEREQDQRQFHAVPPVLAGRRRATLGARRLDHRHDGRGHGGRRPVRVDGHEIGAALEGRELGVEEVDAREVARGAPATGPRAPADGTSSSTKCTVERTGQPDAVRATVSAEQARTAPVARWSSRTWWSRSSHGPRAASSSGTARAHALDARVGSGSRRRRRTAPRGGRPRAGRPSTCPTPRRP